MDLEEKLKRIEVLFDGAKTEGEGTAAARAKQRVLDRVKQERSFDEKGFTVALRDWWGKRLFVALCNKYDLRTYKYKLGTGCFFNRPQVSR